MNQTEEKLLEGKIPTLEKLFEATKSNYSNLHEHLNITKTKLTRLLNNPKEEGNIEIAKDISIVTGVRASVIIQQFKLGYPNITLEQMDNLSNYEEPYQITHRA